MGTRRTGALSSLAVVTAVLAAAASAVALLWPELYARDPEIIAPQLLGQDLVTLALAAPGLLAASWLAAKGSARATVVQGGLLVYMAYTYATYAFGARFNALFVVYCAILGLSTYGLFVAMPGVLAIGSRILPERLPRRTLAGVLFGISAVFTVLWGVEIVGALLDGTAPISAIDAGTPTSFIHVLDLSFVLPLGALAATLLLMRREAGAALAGIFLVKGMTIALAVLSMALFSALADQAVNVPVAGAMVGVVLLVGLVGWRYARAFDDVRRPARPAGVRA